MKYVSTKIVSLALLTLIATGCGRQTTVTPLTAVSASSSASTAASSNQFYVLGSDGSIKLFSVTAATGYLTLVSTTSTAVSVNTVQQLVIGPWTYQVNAITNAIDQYSSDNMNVIVESYMMTSGITSIVLK